MTVNEIMNLIEEEDVEFIRLQFTDLFGNLKNLAVTPGQMAKVFANRYRVDGNAMFAGTREYEDDFYLHPDTDSFVILPWRPQQGKVAKIICDVFNPDGTPFVMSPRYLLTRTLEKAREMGYEFYVDPECEFFLYHTDENGAPTTVTHETAGYMDVGPADFGENARRDIVLTLEQMGFEIESSHHEKAPAQHEIDFREQEASVMADSITTFRFAVRSIAKRFGLYATFMPKPKKDAAGSGMHLHLAMVKDGKNVFRGGDGVVTDEARWFIGGILAHANALCAVTNPIVNSYKRLLNGFDAPMYANWGTKGEQVFVKLNRSLEDTKVELRFPDSAANPYLSLAVSIAAGLDGIEKKLEPGTEMNPSAPLLPGTLKDAVESLRSDEVLVNVLGEEFAALYSDVKTAEWSDYMKQVSDWEIARYLGKM